jgi:hypothetical protein
MKRRSPMLTGIVFLVLLALLLGGCTSLRNAFNGDDASAASSSAKKDPLADPKDKKFHSSITAITPAVKKRMGKSWHKGCPVGLSGLRYVLVTHIGIDNKPHTGELVVNKKYAKDIVSVFGTLYRAKFPIERMRMAGKASKPAVRNTTAALYCRAVTGGTKWSMHSYGEAIDINPFVNPYQKGSKIIPAQAGAYLNRSNVRPGMIRDGDVVVKAFRSIGWEWGGDYDSLKDYMHFSSNGG